MLQQSEAKIRHLLSDKCAEDLVFLLKEKGPWDQTPLHVSTSWPQGMQLIFELAGKAIKNVIDVRDSSGKTALDYAVDLGEIDSAKQLVSDAHAMINLESGYTLFKLQQARRSQEAVSFSAHILANSRQQLYQLASHTLESFKRLGPRMVSSRTELILQEDAFDVIQQLRAVGVDIHEADRHIRPGSIYHSLYAPSVELLEALYHAGFSHTNVTYFGFCPQMTIMHQPVDTREDVLLDNSDDTRALLEVIIWFRDHGADLYRPIPQTAVIGSSRHHDDSRPFRLIHQLSEQLGHFMGTTPTSDDNVEEPLLSMLRDIALSPEADPCTCFCSPKGCTAISLLARGSHDNRVEPKLEAFSISDSLNPDSAATFRVISDLLRLVTFETLGMSHTCCKYIHDAPRQRANYIHDTRSGKRVSLIPTGQYRILKLMDPEEIAEIQEEDKHLSLLLEEIVSGFEEYYRSSGESCRQYWRNYLAAHWTELIAEKRLSLEDEDAIRNIGVILHDTRQSDAA